MDGLTHTHAPTLLTAARAVGLVVSTTAGLLSVRGPKGAEGLVRLLQEHKSLVLDALERETAPRPHHALLNPTWPPRDPRLASWPVTRCERWGRRANALIDSGMNWRVAERQAFAEVLYEPETDLAAPVQDFPADDRRGLT